MIPIAALLAGDDGTTDDSTDQRGNRTGNVGGDDPNRCAGLMIAPVGGEHKFE
jgi:hypothetical protein